MNDAPASPQRHEDGDPELGQLFQEELAPIALRQRRRHRHAEWQLARRRFDPDNFQRDVASFCVVHEGGVFMAIAVEQANAVARAKPADRGEMVRLRPVQGHQAGGQKSVDEETLGHVVVPCTKKCPVIKAHPVRSE